MSWFLMMNSMGKSVGAGSLPPPAPGGVMAAAPISTIV